MRKLSLKTTVQLVKNLSWRELQEVEDDTRIFNSDSYMEPEEELDFEEE